MKQKTSRGRLMKWIALMTLMFAAVGSRESVAATAYAFGSVCQSFYLGHGLCQIVCDKGSCSGTECIIAKGGGVCNGPIVKAYDPKLVVDPKAGLEQLFSGDSAVSEAPVSEPAPVQSEMAKPVPQQ